MTNISESDVYRLLKSIENSDDDFSIVTKSNDKGEGFIGDVVFVTLINNRTQHTTHLTIKQQKTDGNKDFLEWLDGPFNNEIYFYDTVWPTLQKRLEVETLSFVPKCLAVSKLGLKRIVMEDLKAIGFKLKSLSDPFSKEELTRIFTIYGIFHGLSTSMKEQNCEEFSRLVKGIKIFEIFTGDDFHTINFLQTIKDIQNFFDPEIERDLINRLQEYDRNGQQLIYNAGFGEKEFRTIVHGDVWSNNFMFRYNDRSELEDIKIIDFQFIGLGSPVSDLSYLLYSSGAKQDYDDLHDYLKVYHSSLSDTLEKFDLDAENIYSYDELRTEWKKYSKYGFAMGLLAWKIKTADPKALKETQDFTALKLETSDIDKYKQRARDLVLHCYNEDFL